MFSIGRICVKLAGRDAKGIAVIIDILDDQFVMIDGTVRRRKCNVKHLLPLEKTIDVKKEEDHDSVISKLKDAGFIIPDKRKGDSRKAGPRPKKQKKEKAKPVKEEKPKKEAVKKAEPKVEEKKPEVKQAEVKVKKETPKSEAKPAVKAPVKKE